MRATVTRLPSSAAAAADVLRDALSSALSTGLPQVNRLSYARTSVRFELPCGGVTILLDRKPPAVAERAEPAEIVLQLSDEQATQLAAGQLPTTAAVVGGAIAVRGPVRRYLEVDPILRSLLRRVAGTGDDAPAVRPSAEPRRSVAAELLAVETRGLHKAFGANKILQGVNLTVPEGVISVILGPSGTGKSVMLQHIIGLLQPDAGDVIIRGRPLSGMSRSEVLALRTEIGVMFQDGALFSAMDIYDNVAFPLRQHTDLNETEVREAVLARLDAVGLRSAIHARPGSLSGGMRKRAGLARALILEPSIVLCDEPDSGLDPVRTALLGELLVDQHAETGGTMIVITHNIALARRVGEHFSVLWQGQVLESGLRDDVLASDNAFVRQFLAGETVGPLTMDA